MHVLGDDVFLSELQHVSMLSCKSQMLWQLVEPSLAGYP